MFDFNKQFNFSEADRDMTDALFGIFFMNQQARKRNEAWFRRNLIKEVNKDKNV